MKLGDIFTVEEFGRAVKIARDKPNNLHHRLRDEIVLPALPRINAATGQENNADYFAYLLEYVVTGVMSSND